MPTPYIPTLDPQQIQSLADTIAEQRRAQRRGHQSPVRRGPEYATSIYDEPDWLGRRGSPDLPGAADMRYIMGRREALQSFINRFGLEAVPPEMRSPDEMRVFGPGLPRKYGAPMPRERVMRPGEVRPEPEPEPLPVEVTPTTSEPTPVVPRPTAEPRAVQPPTVPLRSRGTPAGEGVVNQFLNWLLSKEE